MKRTSHCSCVNVLLTLILFFIERDFIPHPIIREIPPLHVSFFQCNVAIQCCCEAEDDAAFHLGFNTIRIYRQGGVNGTYNVVNSSFTFFNR